MKKVGAVLLFVVAGMFAIVTLVSFSDTELFTTAFRVATILITVLFVILGVLLLKRKPKVKKIKTIQNEGQPREEKIFTGKYIDGLPIASGTACTFSINRDGMSINAAGTSFGIDIRKITDMQIKTETELQQQYVSSVGGAVAGAVLMGPLGAIIGGRTKKKKVSSTVEHFFIVTYNSEEGIKYIVIGNIPYFAVNKAIREHMGSVPRSVNRVEL